MYFYPREGDLFFFITRKATATFWRLLEEGYSDLWRLGRRGDSCSLLEDTGVSIG